MTSTPTDDTTPELGPFGKNQLREIDDNSDLTSEVREIARYLLLIPYADRAAAYAEARRGAQTAAVIWARLKQTGALAEADRVFPQPDADDPAATVVDVAPDGHVRHVPGEDPQRAAVREMVNANRRHLGIDPPQDTL